MGNTSLIQFRQPALNFSRSPDPSSYLHTYCFHTGRSVGRSFGGRVRQRHADEVTKAIRRATRYTTIHVVISEAVKQDNDVGKRVQTPLLIHFHRILPTTTIRTSAYIYPPLLSSSSPSISIIHVLRPFLPTSIDRGDRPLEPLCSILFEVSLDKANLMVMHLCT